MVRPCLAGRRRQRRDPLDGAFRHVAGHRGDAIELLLADAIGERVDQAGDVGLRFLRQRGDRLLRRQRLGERGGKGHDLDAEAGIDGFDLVAEQPRQTLHVAHRQRRSDPDRLDAVVDPVKEQDRGAGRRGLWLQAPRKAATTSLPV